jgi:flagellar hook assembly protein FlgD
MPVSGKIEISIWNLQGRKLSTIYSGMKSKGSHSVSWDTKQQGARMPSGQYLMVLDMNGRRTHKTFLIID